MTAPDSTARRGTRSRRAVLAGLGGLLGASVGPGIGRAGQTATATDEPAQITTKAVVPDVGGPWTGNYVGQFVVFTDPTPRDDVSPPVVADCDFADWPASRTRGYQVLLADRLTDEPRGVTVGAYLDAADPQIDVGRTFIIQRTHACPDDFLGLELEEVPVETFVPEREQVEHPLVGEEPGPTLPGTGTPTGDPVAIDAPGQPGLGAPAALAGVLGAALLRRLVGSTDDGG